MREFDDRHYVALTRRVGNDQSNEANFAENVTSEIHHQHGYVTTLSCVNSGCNASFEIRDDSDRLNTHR